MRRRPRKPWDPLPPHTRAFPGRTSNTSRIAPYSLNKTPLPAGANNVSFKGYDHDEVGNNYCCSIPVEKALDPYGDTIVAWSMNGEDIPRSHGYPVRLIVPGNAGARNCKVRNTPRGG